MTYTAGQRLLASQMNVNPQFIGSKVLGVNTASITINVPSGVFNQIQGVFCLRDTLASNSAIWSMMQLNGDSGSNYAYQYWYSASGTPSVGTGGGLVTAMDFALMPENTCPANYFGTGTFVIGGVSSAIYKTMSSTFNGPIGTNAGFVGNFGGIWQSTAAVTSVTISGTSGYVAGSSLSLYGWN